MTTIPQDAVQLGLGALLLLFGMRWLRKAILRSAGVIQLHDEEKAYAEESATLRALGHFTQGWDRVAVITSFKITMIEGIEVVFIVIAVGASGRWLLLPASLGALVRPTAGRTAWRGATSPRRHDPQKCAQVSRRRHALRLRDFLGGRRHGSDLAGGDAALAALNGGISGGGALAVRLCRARARPTLSEDNMKCSKPSLNELFGLFVDDGSFAALVLVWLGVCWLLCCRDSNCRPPCRPSFSSSGS